MEKAQKPKRFFNKISTILKSRVAYTLLSVLVIAL